MGNVSRWLASSFTDVGTVFITRCLYTTLGLLLRYKIVYGVGLACVLCIISYFRVFFTSVMSRHGARITNEVLYEVVCYWSCVITRL